MGSFVALLAAAVFLWGTAYKVSLYPVQNNASTIPVAKLLSEKERPAPKPKVKSVRSRLLVAARCTLWLFLAARFRDRRAALRIEPVIVLLRPSVRTLALLHRFSFRPPPFSIA